MLRTKAIKKIFMTTLSMFIILCTFTLTSFMNNNVLKTNLEIEEISGIVTDDIYLLSKNNYLVKKKILIDSDDIAFKIKKALSEMVNSSNNKYSNELIGPIPEGTNIIDVIVGEDIITVNFSKELLNVNINHEKHMISAIVYTVINIGNVKGVSILVEGNFLDKYPNTGESLNKVLDKNIDINREFRVVSRDDISKVVVYYLDDIDDNLYYVPVTKYLNDSRDKIEIIVEELSSSYIYEDNLMSFLNNKVKLLEHSIENDVFFLNFYEYLFDSNDIVLDEVLYCISYSVFDNYDVSMVMFQVNGKEVNHVFRTDIYYKLKKVLEMQVLLLYNLIYQL